MDAPGLRLPQMGWNALDFMPGAHPLLDGLLPGDHAYFVHSYALRGGDPADLVATTEYGGAVPPWSRAATAPARSSMWKRARRSGLRILANFLRWAPEARRAMADAMHPGLAVERAAELPDDDLQALCEAADAAIIEGGGFGWVKPPGRLALRKLLPRRAAGAGARAVRRAPGRHHRRLRPARAARRATTRRRRSRPPSCTPSSRPMPAGTAWRA